MGIPVNTTVNIKPEQLAEYLKDSGEQALFFNAMAKHFKSFSYGDRDGMQMLWIKDDLTVDGKEFIKKLNEYVNGEK